MKNYGKIVVALIAVWFLFSLGASALHLFKNDANRVGIAVAVAAVTPLILFALWLWLSASFRQFTLSIAPQTLTAAQVWRIIGFTFLLLEARGGLPAIFALPAGYGDMFIGATAAFVAWKAATPAHRNLFIFWQALGITDLVLAVTFGTTAPLIDPRGASMVVMTVLPLSLIPTFLVPLFVIFHVICIAQARKWNSDPQRDRRTVKPLQQFAV
jgi:hypothetical protein